MALRILAPAGTLAALRERFSNARAGMTRRERNAVTTYDAVTDAQRFQLLETVIAQGAVLTMPQGLCSCGCGYPGGPMYLKVDKKMFSGKDLREVMNAYFWWSIKREHAVPQEFTVL